MSPEEIEALFRNGGGPGGPRGGADEVPLTEEELLMRIVRLREILVTVRQHWASGSLDLDLITEKLGDGSRDVSWRTPIGESGLLDFFLDILATRGLRQSLKIHSLRLIGNSCADQDENRARVVQGERLPSIIALLDDDTTLAFVIPVLYNVCVDYEPAQLQACNAGLSVQLTNIISGPRLIHCQAFLNIIGKLLGLLVAHEPELKIANPATPTILLGLATNRASPVDLEDFCALTSVALAYLANEQYQSQLLSNGGFPVLQLAFHDSYTQFDLVNADPEELAQLKQVRQALVQIFADISALPAFALMYPLGSPVVQQLQACLRTPRNYTHLQTAACIALGNLARSDKTSIALTQEVYLPLFDLLTSTQASSTSGQSAGRVGGLSQPGGMPPLAPPPQQLVHAIISFLKNLAIPSTNKPLLGGLLDPPLSLLPRIWSDPSATATPQLQFAAISLTRLLLAGCPTNVRRFCAPLSPDPASPAHDRSNLHVLTALFARLDAEPAKMEAARAVAAVCRALHSTPVLPLLPAEWAVEDEGFVWSPPSPTPSSVMLGDPVGVVAPYSSPEGGDAPAPTPTAAEAEMAVAQTRRARFYAAHSEINKPLTYLASQRRFPALRSEAWFVFALMSRAIEGARVVVRALQPFEAIRALVEAVSGRDMFDGHRLLRAGEGAGADPDAEFMQGLEEADGNADGRGDAAGGAGTESNGAGGVTDTESVIEDLGLEPRPLEQTQAQAPVTDMAKIDRENGLVIVAEILRNFPNGLPPFRRLIFEDMLRTGGELILHEKRQEQDSGEGGEGGEGSENSHTGNRRLAGVLDDFVATVGR